jgi:hypothetical protein
MLRSAGPQPSGTGQIADDCQVRADDHHDTPTVSKGEPLRARIITVPLMTLAALLVPVGAATGTSPLTATVTPLLNVATKAVGMPPAP